LFLLILPKIANSVTFSTSEQKVTVRDRNLTTLGKTLGIEHIPDQQLSTILPFRAEKTLPDIPNPRGNTGEASLSVTFCTFLC